MGNAFGEGGFAGVRLVPRIAAALAAAVTVTACGGPSLKYLVGGGKMDAGYYQPAAEVVCDILNPHRQANDFRCVPEATSGRSVANIDAVVAGELDFAVAQSDYVHQAVTGTGVWECLGAQPDLRAVLSLYPEALTLVAAEDSRIRSLGDLRGRRVNIGLPGSVHHAMAVQALEAAGLDWRTDIRAVEEEAADGPRLLEEIVVDAFFIVAAHPSSVVRKAAEGRRKAYLVPVEPVEKLVREHPYYAAVSIPVSWYPKAANDRDVPSLAVKALLVTSSRVPEYVAYAYAGQVFTDIDVLRAKHPACRFNTWDDMVEALAAPVHAGALRFYEEQGLRVR